MIIDTKQIVGKMQWKISLQTVSTSRNAYGEEVHDSWNEVAEIWAWIDFRSAGENEILRKETAVTRVRFVFYKRTDFDEKDRISWDSDTYDIHSILETEDKMYQVVEGIKRSE